MNPQQAAILAGAFRTLLAGVLGWVVSKGYLTSDLLNMALLGVGTLALAWWSLATKQGSAAEWYPMLLGAARNIATVALTFAAGRGWIGQDQVAPMVAAIGTIAVAFWSSESKYLTVSAKRVVPLLLGLVILPFMLAACASVPTPLPGNDFQITVYNAGEEFLGPVETIAGLSSTGLVPIPPQACQALAAADAAYVGVENTARDPNFQNGTAWQQAWSAAQNAIAAAIAIVVDLAAKHNTAMMHEPLRLKAANVDPTAAQWSTLNSQLSQSIASVRCL